MVGGTILCDEIHILQQGIHVVVGTPDRVFDMMNKGYFKTDYLKILTIDEADQMLARDFKPRI